MNQIEKNMSEVTRINADNANYEAWKKNDQILRVNITQRIWNGETAIFPLGKFALTFPNGETLYAKSNIEIEQIMDLKGWNRNPQKNQLNLVSCAIADDGSVIVDGVNRGGRAVSVNAMKNRKGELVASCINSAGHIYHLNSRGNWNQVHNKKGETL